LEFTVLLLATTRSQSLLLVDVQTNAVNMANATESLAFVILDILAITVKPEML